MRVLPCLSSVLCPHGTYFSLPTRNTVCAPLSPYCCTNERACSVCERGEQRGLHGEDIPWKDGFKTAFLLSGERVSYHREAGASRIDLSYICVTRYVLSLTTRSSFFFFSHILALNLFQYCDIIHLYFVSHVLVVMLVTRCAQYVKPVYLYLYTYSTYFKYI